MQTRTSRYREYQGTDSLLYLEDFDAQCVFPMVSNKLESLLTPSGKLCLYESWGEIHVVVRQVRQQCESFETLPCVEFLRRTVSEPVLVS